MLKSGSTWKSWKRFEVPKLWHSAATLPSTEQKTRALLFLGFITQPLLMTISPAQSISSAAKKPGSKAVTLRGGWREFTSDIKYHHCSSAPPGKNGSTYTCEILVAVMKSISLHTQNFPYLWLFMKHNPTLSGWFSSTWTSNIPSKSPKRIHVVFFEVHLFCPKHVEQTLRLFP